MIVWCYQPCIYEQREQRPACNGTGGWDVARVRAVLVTPCIVTSDTNFVPPHRRRNKKRISYSKMFLCNRPVTMETRCSKVIQTIQKRNRLKIRSYHRYGEHGKKMFVFTGLCVHAHVRVGTCAFTLKIVNTLIKNSSRDDRSSIST